MEFSPGQAILEFVRPTGHFNSNTVGNGTSAIDINKSPWLDERIIPAYVSAASVVVLVIGTIMQQMQPASKGDASQEPAGTVLSRGSGSGSRAILAFKITRFLALVTLLALAITSAIQQVSWFSAFFLISVGYASVLALLNLLANPRKSLTYSSHVTLVSFSVFAIYAYRDLWPLMTFTLRPADENEGDIVWIKVALSAFVAIVEPLLEPYPYIPVDPEHPMTSLNPEQTAPIISFLFFIFVDPMVWRAYRVPHLSHDQLPPLCDYDKVKHLIQNAYHNLDPYSGAKKGLLFFAFLKIFRKEVIYQALILLFEAFFKLAAPVGINRLLSYLENKEDITAERAVVKPWVWILWIALGPMIDTLLMQLYTFISSGVVVRTEALITALAFDHSLRIRLKADVDSSEEQPQTGDDAAGKSTTSNLIGRINNLVTGDLDSINQGRDFLSLAVSVPAQIALAMWFLYVVLGWSVFVGLAVMIALFPVPARIASLMNGIQQRKMKATDARVQAVTEVMGVLRMIKLFGWERRAAQDIAEKREFEVDLVWRARMLDMTNFFVNHTIPLVHMVVTYATFTLVMKRDLTASIVFSSMTAFNMLRNQLRAVTSEIPTVIKAKVSLGRVADFLWNTELLDAYDDEQNDVLAAGSAHTEDIGFGKADFTWTNDTDKIENTTPKFCLHVDEDVVFKGGAINLIVGPTGSGKTSVLMALLGEMHYVPQGPGSWVNLPKSGGVAYAAQESWVQNTTIKENITMGYPYDEARYKKVLYQCALTQDLRLLEAGDATEVGEKGLTLSGGQKARVTLARAVYSPTDILLLDDIFAALDVHTIRWIVEKCLKGDVLKDRTVLLVTHNVVATSSVASFIVSLGTNGQVTAKDSIQDATEADPSLAEGIKHEAEAIELDEHEDKDMDATANVKEGQLVIAEEIAIGRVSWQAVKVYLVALAGNWPLLFWSQTFLGLTLSEFFDVVEMWWLGRWAYAYAVQEHGKVRVSYYLAVYSAIILSVVLFSAYGTLVFTLGSKRAARVLNARLVSSLLGSTFRWLDVTPVSRVITRCTQDIQTVDTAMQAYLRVFFIVTLNMLIKLSAVVIYTPVFLLPAIFTALLGAWLGHMYVQAQMSVKRELSIAKSPVLSVFGSAIEGLVSIRAYSAQEYFRTQLLSRIDHYSRAARAFNNLQRWISVRIDMLSAIFSAAVAFYLVYSGYSTDPSSIGFILTVAVTFTEMVLWCVNMYNEFEIHANNLERIHQYLNIEQEPKNGETPPAYWPASGELQVEKLTARYSVDGPTILHGISFTAKAGERVGIVGRTGSGKSTLTLALLRCIPTEGLVMFDGLPTDSITLDALRSNITIIPQMPELMSGTLRHNLDPFGQADDATLNEALRSAGLFSLQSDSDDNRITLDTKIAGGGSNLSVGQRQIVALARAIVRRSKLLILDEATSAIDYETDAVIQKTLRTELEGVTVLTVAHRLQTIMDYDKIIVLDAGRVVEFDAPKALLENQDGLFRSLVDESADKEALYAMAEAGGPRTLRLGLR